MLTRGQYFKNLGFKADPFSSTNAESEEYLSEYFVNPPYFSSLVGDLDNPKSSIVLAPRGFGKTAQRKRIEQLAEETSDIISIVYDNFPVENRSKVQQVTFEHHIAKLCTSLLIAFLSKLHIEEARYSGVEFDEYERKALLDLINKYLKNLNPTEISHAIGTIKGIKGKLYDLWITASKPISSIINLILATANIGKIDLTFTTKQEEVKIPIIEDLYFIENLFEKVRIKGVFLLIDKVDENHLTGNDSSSSYLLIQPLIKELKLLERKTVVLKFFLWDKLSDHWSQDVRLDRIENYSLEWNRAQVKEMINARLKVLSDKKINSLEKLLQCEDYLIDFILMFAQNSPRDLINILKNVFDVHINRLNNEATIPSREDIIEGIDKFCETKFEEIITEVNQRARLKRIKTTTFTIPLLSNDVFKESDNKIRNMIMPWTRSGIAITLSDRVKISKGKKPVNLYLINDIRIARVICSNQKLEIFIENNVVQCTECEKIYVFDKENRYGLKEINCPKCQSILVDAE